MKNFRKLIVSLMLVCLLLPLIACSAPVTNTPSGVTTSATTKGATNATSSGSTAKLTPHNLTILFTKGGFEQPPANDIIYQQMVKESGVTFTQIAPPAANYKEKVTAIMASGDLPDMVRLQSLNDVYYYQEQGALMPIEDFINAEKTPNYWNIVKDLPAIQAVTFAGHRWGMPTWWDPHKCNTLIRGDWLDELKLETPKTLEDFVAVAKAFKENNMGGGATTYGFGGGQFSYKGNTAVFDLIMGAFGVMKDYWYKDASGTLKPYNTSPDMKRALEYCAKLNKDGLIDPEWVTVNGNGPQYEAMEKGAYGITQMWWTNEPKIEVEMRKTNPKAEWRRIAPPIGPDGESGLRGISGMTWCFVVTKNCKDTVGVAQLVDYLHGDPGMYTSYTGVEGVHWQRIGQKKAIIEPAFTNDSKWIQWYSMFELETPLLQIDSYLLQSRLDSYKWPLIMDDADLIITAAEQTYSADLNSLVAETFTNIINGKASIDSFDKMVEAWNKQGGATWEKELNLKYKELKK